QGISDLIAKPGLINVDFADVKTIMFDKGSALMGIGVATGENRATEAAKKEISSPLLETSIDGAHGILMNITGGTNLRMFEVPEAADLVTSAADEEVNVILGYAIKSNMTEEIVVTVIATGFDESKKTNEQPNKRQSIKRQHAASKEKEDANEPVVSNRPPEDEDTLDIPAFLRNRN